jgi:hypothetical protein
VKYFVKMKNTKHGLNYITIIVHLWGCVRLAYLPEMMALFSNLLCKNQMGVNLPTLPFLLLFAIPSYSHAFISFTIYTSVACAIGSSVSTSSTDFSFQNLGFWNLFEFSAAEIT